MVAKSESRISIDLASYSDPRRRGLAVYDFYAVYVMTFGEGASRKIGFARDPAARMARLQTGLPDKLRAEYLLWTPALGVASLIERRVQQALKRVGAHEYGEWFRVAPSVASQTIRAGAEKLFPSIEFCDHEQMLALLDAEGFGRRPSSNYSDHERNLLVRTLMTDPRSPVLPKLELHVWSELIRPMTKARLHRAA